MLTRLRTELITCPLSECPPIIARLMNSVRRLTRAISITTAPTPVRLRQRYYVQFTYLSARESYNIVDVGTSPGTSALQYRLNSQVNELRIKKQCMT
ncbi:unnamed protein product [Arctia plantaginis]|uniref:Uncharacterized protein n=1 Tax=Arctia plantaginis TaxID=874455 RepID=A0A8S0Z3Y5_ARCPL|nr:unnamed protein product [Arctia plantaginis]CAB3237436.1 unnamed protein product [Arctia plantaginis]